MAKSEVKKRQERNASRLVTIVLMLFGVFFDWIKSDWSWVFYFTVIILIVLAWEEMK